MNIRVICYCVAHCVSYGIVTNHVWFLYSIQSSLPDNITIGLPEGCLSDSNGGNCKYIARIGPNLDNNSFVDFYLETTAIGYIAVGFSLDRTMVRYLYTCTFSAF